MKVYVSITAKISLEEIIIFLKLHWTQKEIATLKNDIKKFVRTVNEGILKHQSAEDFPQSKFALIGNKQVKVFYELKEDMILIKLFWHCKQDPRKLSDLLNSE